jgi:succinoglycan biosynthesis protein ExoO
MSLARPLVSVVTANFNGARHLREAIAAVQAQTLADLELIVVDDASTDESVPIVQAEAARDPRIRLLRQDQNGGPGAARNAGLDAAGGRWIAVFDADDLMDSERLARLVARAKADDADIVVDNLSVFPDGEPEVRAPLLTGRDWAQARWIGLADYIGASRMYAPRPGPGYLKPLISAALTSGAGARYRTDLPIGEDYDLVLRLLAQGARLRYEPQALYGYRRHRDSVSRRLKPKHLQAMLLADAEFDQAFPDLPPAAARAQAGRRRSLENALIYDTVVERLKGGDLKGGIAAGLGTPAVWPLLAMPLKARLRRMLAGGAGMSQAHPA